METSRGLETDMIEPFLITAKSEQQQSHADDPKEVPSAAAAQGVSRMRRNWVVSFPSIKPMPLEPIASGKRAPVDSPTCTGRGALDREVVDDDADVAPVDTAEAGDLAVARCRVRLRIVVRGAEQADLEETPGVDECVEPLLGTQLPLRIALRQLGGTAHATRLGAAPVKRRKCLFMCH
jgi:hypothetical protein